MFFSGEVLDLRVCYSDGRVRRTRYSAECSRNVVGKNLELEGIIERNPFNRDLNE